MLMTTTRSNPLHQATQDASASHAAATSALDAYRLKLLDVVEQTAEQIAKVQDIQSSLPPLTGNTDSAHADALGIVSAADELAVAHQALLSHIEALEFVQGTAADQARHVGCLADCLEAIHPPKTSEPDDQADPLVEEPVIDVRPTEKPVIVTPPTLEPMLPLPTAIPAEEPTPTPPAAIALKPFSLHGLSDDRITAMFGEQWTTTRIGGWCAARDMAPPTLPDFLAELAADYQAIHPTQEEQPAEEEQVSTAANAPIEEPVNEEKKEEEQPAEDPAPKTDEQRVKAARPNTQLIHRPANKKAYLIFDGPKQIGNASKTAEGAWHSAARRLKL